MLILTFKEISYKHNNENKAMSNIKIEDIGKDKSLIPIEIVMRDQTPVLITITSTLLLICTQLMVLLGF